MDRNHEQLLDRCRGEVQRAARTLMASRHWSTDTPVILITNCPDHQVHSVSVGTLGCHLPVSAGSSGLPDTLPATDRRREGGEAGDQLSNDQLQELVAKSRRGFGASPRKLLIVILKEADERKPQLISLTVDCHADSLGAS